MSRLDSDRAKSFHNELEKVRAGINGPQNAWKSFIDLALKHCKLCPNRKLEYPVPSFGDVTAKVLILESNPGKLQVEKGSEFIQDTSVMKLLVKYLHELGYNIQDIYLSYAFHCNTQKRTIIDYDRCSLWLSYEVSNLTNCDTIITLGDDAFHMIMGEGYPRLIDVFGSIYNININNKDYKVIPLLHPWFLLRNPRYLPEVSKFIKKVKEEI